MAKVKAKPKSSYAEFVVEEPGTLVSFSATFQLAAHVIPWLGMNALNTVSYYRDTRVDIAALMTDSQVKRFRAWWARHIPGVPDGL